jgi:hypothetical protein
LGWWGGGFVVDVIVAVAVAVVVVATRKVHGEVTAIIVVCGLHGRERVCV